MLWVRFQINSRLLVVKSLVSQNLYMDFQLWERGLVPLIPVLFNGQLLCAGAEGERAPCFAGRPEESLG